MRLITRQSSAVLLGALVIAVAGCGDSSTVSTPSAPQSAPATAATGGGGCATGGGGSAALVSAAPGPEGTPLELGEPLTPEPTEDGQPHDGVQCNMSEQVAYHVHAHLAIFVDGKPRAVPQGIGIQDAQPQDTDAGQFVSGGSCFYWLHTHASDGILHIESPTQTTYTLGQFFAVWGQPLAASQVGPAKGAVTTYVNGKKVGGDPSTVKLTAHAKIQLDVGTPLVAPQRAVFDGL